MQDLGIGGPIVFFNAAHNLSVILSGNTLLCSLKTWELAEQLLRTIHFGFLGTSCRPIIQDQNSDSGAASTVNPSPGRCKEPASIFQVHRRLPQVCPTAPAQWQSLKGSENYRDRERETHTQKHFTHTHTHTYSHCCFFSHYFLSFSLSLTFTVPSSLPHSLWGEAVLLGAGQSCWGRGSFAGSPSLFGGVVLQPPTLHPRN